MDNYQAVYDAVRSRIGHLDAGVLIDRITRCFDFSNLIAQATGEIYTISIEHQRPSVLFRPKLTIDGSQWCALYGDNLQDGVAGFGDSPAKATQDFDNNWNKSLGESESNSG